MRAALPSRSPTTRLSCAAATRSRGTGTGYGDGPRDWPVGGRDVRCSTRPRSPRRSTRSADVAAARAARGAVRRAASRSSPSELVDDRSRCLALRRARVRVALARRRGHRRPALLDVLDEPDVRARTRSEAYRAASSSSCRDRADGDDGARVLRAWKRREFLRIALRDLLGARRPRRPSDASSPRSPTVCLAAALELAAPTIPFAVIGMGKLGGTRAQLRERRRRALRARRRRRRGRPRRARSARRR